MSTERVQRAALIAAGFVLGALLSAGISAQPPSIIKGIDPLTKRVVDLGDLSQNLVLLQKGTNSVLAQLTTLNARLTRSIPVFSMNAIDPCFGGPKGNVAISQTAATRLVVGQGGKRIAMCYARVVAGAAEIPSFTEGTGTTCGTGTLAVSGSTTAANGESYAVNGGFSGGMGLGMIGSTAVNGNDLCLAQSTSNRLSGQLAFVYY